MTQTLYSLRTDGDQYRITKFVDGDVESSYLCSETECECPAGVRPSCRHRQMLPNMVNQGLANSHWFYDYARGYACDFQGGSKQLADALANPSDMQAALIADGEKLAALTGEDHGPYFIEDAPAAGSILGQPAEPTQPKPGWRRL